MLLLLWKVARQAAGELATYVRLPLVAQTTHKTETEDGHYANLNITKSIMEERVRGLNAESFSGTSISAHRL